MGVKADKQATVNTLASISRRYVKNKVSSKLQSFATPVSERRTALLVGDAFLIILTAGSALLLWRLGSQTAGDHFDATAILKRWYWFPTLLGGWWLLAWLNNLYDIPSSGYRLTTTVRISVTGALALLLYLIIFFFIPQELPRRFFLYFLLLALPAITLWRWGYAFLVSISPLRHRILIVGRGERAYSMASALTDSPQLNYQVVGYVDETVDTARTARDGLPVWGREPPLPRLVTQLQAHEVVIAKKRAIDKNFLQNLIECQARGVQISLMPDLYEKLYHKIPVEHVDPAWALHIIQGRPLFSRLQLASKRLLDFLLSLIGLMSFTPLFPLMALAIRLDSAGPIFYRQTRCGRAGKTFSIVKFRTMTANAEQDGQARWATREDPRITRVGRLLRRTRLDELPQLYNVLRGDMSIVGPRPERPEFVETLEQEIPFYHVRMMIKPGLTGWAQTHYDYGNSAEDALIKLQYDFYYLRHWSLWLDLYIIFRTVAVVLKFKGT